MLGILMGRSSSSTTASDTLNQIASGHKWKSKHKPGYRPTSLLRCNLLSKIATTLSLDKFEEEETEERSDGVDDINFLSMHPDFEQNAKKGGLIPDIGVAARYQEIFVDLVAMKTALETASARYVLDPRFKSMLNEDDMQFRTELLAFIKGLSKESQRSNAWQSVGRMLKEIGYDDKYQDRDSFITALEKGRVHAKSSSPSSSTPHSSKASPLASKTPPPSTSPTAPTPSSTTPTTTPSPGHVFIANNSVCDVYVDAFLVPCEIGRSRSGRVPAGTIHTQWRRRLRNEDNTLYKEIMKSDSRADLVWPNASELMCFFKHWPFGRFKDNPIEAIPMPVLGEVGYSNYQLTRDEHVDALRQTVAHFIDLTLEMLRDRKVKPLARRMKYLFALPAVGTGYGNAGDVTGEVLRMLLELCSERVRTNDDLDVVIVTADSATFTHAQSLRRKMMRADASALLWPAFRVLSLQRVKEAKELAILAAREELSFFIGAGVSIGAGGFSWLGLLWKIEEDFRVPKLQEKWRGRKDSGLRIADDLKKLCDSKKDKNGEMMSLKARIAKYTDRPFPSLLMVLLASIPVKGVITQNYDRHAELALDHVNIRQKEGMLSVIPYHPVKGARTWLLKMHGCVSAIEDIVITSRDFKTFEHSRLKALGGLVQAELMTSHMLFVGFSMTDPNYLRIIQEVRNALQPRGGGGGGGRWQDERDARKKEEKSKRGGWVIRRSVIFAAVLTAVAAFILRDIKKKDRLCN